jgi:hypothetical protein
MGILVGIVITAFLIVGAVLGGIAFLGRAMSGFKS